MNYAHEFALGAIAFGTVVTQLLIAKRLDAIDAILQAHDDLLATMQVELFGRKL